MNAMNLELYNDMSMSIDELVSGDVEVSLSKRSNKIFGENLTSFHGFTLIAKAIIPANRITVIIDFLEMVGTKP